MDRSSTATDAGRQWHIVSRWHEYEGEARANLLRIAGIGLFYLVELMNYHGLRVGRFEAPPIVDLKFHQIVTGLAFGWGLVALVVLLCQKYHVFPATLKYVTTAVDLGFLTGILVVADGPKSPLVVGYFLIVVLASLRFSLGLVRFAAAGAIACYILLLVHARWYAGREISVSRHHQVIVLLALALAGVMLGQVIRRAARMADEYAARLAPPQEDKP